MLSWKLWRVLLSPMKDYTPRLVAKIPPDSGYDFIIFLSIPLWLLLCGLFSIVLTPLVIFVFLNFFGIRAAWNISGTLALQRESGRSDLLFVTAAGTFAIMLDLCRLYSQKLNKQAEDLAKSIVLFIACLAGTASLAVLFFDQSNITYVFETIVFLGIVLASLVLEYRQMLVVNNLIGMLAGSIGERNNARLAAIAGSLGVQLICYAIPFFFVGVFNQLYFPTLINIGVFILTAGSVITSVYIVREIIIICLWRWLRMQINDDVPAFTKIKVK